MDLELERLLAEVAELTDRDKIDQAKEALGSAVTRHLRNMITANGGEIGPAVLAEAERLYDAPGGLVPTIAYALGLSGSDLRKLLGKSQQVTCKVCGRTFTTFVERHKGGYAQPKDTCKSCKRERSREHSEALLESRLERQHVVAMDAEILASSSPLDLEFFQRHLQSFEAAWLSGEVYQTSSYYVDGPRLGPGCMVCGRQPAELLVATLRPERGSPFWETALSIRLSSMWAEEFPWPPLTTHFQALWRVEPSSYFSEFPYFPITGMVLVMLCPEHQSLVAETHTRLR